MIVPRLVDTHFRQGMDLFELVIDRVNLLPKLVARIGISSCGKDKYVNSILGRPSQRVDLLNRGIANRQAANTLRISVNENVTTRMLAVGKNPV